MPGHSWPCEYSEHPAPGRGPSDNGRQLQSHPSSSVLKKQLDSGSIAFLRLYDSEAHTVREVRGESDWSGANGALRAAVSRLVEERRLDEEIHRPLRSIAARPAKLPRP